MAQRIQARRPSLVFFSEEDCSSLAALGARALPRCLDASKPGGVLAELDEIEVNLVDDATIARVHAEFLGDDSPTDVITFHHGEILLSVETACRQALELRTSKGKELALYLIHGLLHLAGYDDHEPDQRREMHKIQEIILEDCWIDLA